MSDDISKSTMRNMYSNSRNDPNSEEEEKTDQIDVPELAKLLEEAGVLKKPCLMVIAGLDMGNVTPIEKDVFVVGRDAQCDLTLEDDGISRKHIQVEKIGKETILVRDLDTTNGTYHNRNAIKKAILNPGDKILLGRNTIIKFSQMDDIEIRYQKEMFESSTKDGLTGIYNRRAIMQKVKSDLSFARRHHLDFTLMIFDIDHFKKINDTFGHQTGDKVLVKLSEIVGNTIRQEDSLGRYGGEEFIVIAQGAHFLGARCLAERIRAAIADTPALAMAPDGQVVTATVSMGSATVDGGAIIDTERLLAIADANLYKAKNDGRNTLVASEVVSSKASEKRSGKTAPHQIIGNGS